MLLRTKTPLFITKPGSKKQVAGADDGHFQYDCAEEIPAASLRGVISSAYEIITNSRYRVFRKSRHEKKLQYRGNDRRKTKYPLSPWDCLDPSLRPASYPDEMSPADRLFGWVYDESAQGCEKQNANKKPWRGKVRISDGIAADNDIPVHSFKKAVPLTILGAPKPEQGRFYVGKQDGSPHDSGISKEMAGYRDGSSLRGRKVYLHHTLGHLSEAEQDVYWNADAGNDGIVREYKRFPKSDNSDKNNRSDQNRSITGWIPPDTEFKFTVCFENLTREELGALLTLLMMHTDKKPYYFRMGLGKPLGLGSVSMEIAWDENNSIPVGTGRDMADRYSSLGEVRTPSLSVENATAIINAYKRAMITAYPLPSKKAVEEPKICPWDGSDDDAYWILKLLEGDIERFKSEWKNGLICDSEIPPFRILDDKLGSDDNDLIALKPRLAEDYAADLEKWRKYSKASEDVSSWGELPFIKDFRLSMKGFDDYPVHYPRFNVSDETEGFKWFAANEKKGKKSLPLIGKDKTLTGTQ